MDREYSFEAKQIEQAKRELNKLLSWATQEPTGPVPDGTQAWVVARIQLALEALNSHPAPAPPPEYVLSEGS